MRAFSLLPAVALGLLCCGPFLCAQESAVGGVEAASRATQPIQAGSSAGAPLGPALLSPSDTSDYPPLRTRDLKLGTGPGMLYPPDAIPPTPVGMLARSESGNPAMVYFALPHRSGSNLSPTDAAIVAARQSDLIRAAAYRGYDLHQSGWLYQQGICPQLQPAALAPADAPVTATGPGFILLHFVRREDGRVSSFTAVVPRADNLPVRTIAVARGSMEQHRKFLSVDTTGAVVNEALPPQLLYASLQPFGGWISASACIAELGGAYPHIPNEPSLSSELTIAPSPYLRLGLNGSREVLFADRVDRTHYVVWDEQVSKKGRMQRARREQFAVVTRPVTNPPIPSPRVLATIPSPPIKLTPYQPSPASSEIK